MEQSSNPPVKRRRNTRQTPEQMQERLDEVKREILNHLGQPAILLVKESRDMVPYFVTIEGNFNYFYGNVRCFGPDGKFRQYLKQSISIIHLITGEQQLIYFDDEI